MKKDIIISGPAASGKSWISYAIESTHKKKCLRVTSEGFEELLTQGIDLKLLKKHSCLIIDECSPQDIIHFDLTLRDFLVSKKDGRIPFPVIYLTQEVVTNSRLGRNNFHIIHCRNVHLY